MIPSRDRTAPAKGMLRAAVALLCSLLPAAAPARGAELLPEVSVRLQAARYAPSEEDFRWNGWIGAGAGLLRVPRATIGFNADVETVIGSVKRAFDANQANYHLEAFSRFEAGTGAVELFFHHVSRHEVDRPKDQAVDWNLLGVRASAPLPASLHLRGRAAASLGHTTLVSLVGYRWELAARLEVEPVARPWGRVYAVGSARGVTARASPELPRGGFVDAWLEAGARFPRQGRSLDAFVAYEHRNDVYLETPAVRDRLLLGLRIGYATSAPPPAGR